MFNSTKGAEGDCIPPFSGQYPKTQVDLPLPDALHVEVEVHRHCSASPWTYPLVNARQREVASQVRAGRSGTLLVSELAPVITLGRRTPLGDLLLRKEELARLGVDCLQTDRGGLATYHGPGQWVLFPVDRLERLTGDPRGVRRVVEGLLEAACDVGRSYEPRVEIRTGCYMGVWTPKGKFASVGIHIEQGILLHGLSVNGFRTPQSFVGLRPCGLDTAMDYLLPSESESEFVQLGRQITAQVLKNFWN